MGFVIESALLAETLASTLDRNFASGRYYQVRLSDKGEIYWLELRGTEVVRHNTEPRTTFWQRAGVAVVAWLPIEWLL
jgi:putative cardiolipin synthase